MGLYPRGMYGPVGVLWPLLESASALEPFWRILCQQSFVCNSARIFGLSPSSPIGRQLCPAPQSLLCQRAVLVPNCALDDFSSSRSPGGAVPWMPVLFSQGHRLGLCGWLWHQLLSLDGARSHGCARRPGWKCYLVAGGMGSSALVVANLFYVVFVPYLVLHYWYLNRQGRRNSLWRSFFLYALGAVAAPADLRAVHLVGRRPVFLSRAKPALRRPQYRQSQCLGGAGFHLASGSRLACFRRFDGRWQSDLHREQSRPAPPTRSRNILPIPVPGLLRHPGCVPILWSPVPPVFLLCQHVAARRVHCVRQPAGRACRVVVCQIVSRPPGHRCYLLASALCFEHDSPVAGENPSVVGNPYRGSGNTWHNTGGNSPCAHSSRPAY